MEMNQDTLETHRTESMTIGQFVSWLVPSEWDDCRNHAAESYPAGLLQIQGHH